MIGQTPPPGPLPEASGRGSAWRVGSLCRCSAGIWLRRCSSRFAPCVRMPKSLSEASGRDLGWGWKNEPRLFCSTRTDLPRRAPADARCGVAALRIRCPDRLQRGSGRGGSAYQRSGNHRHGAAMPRAGRALRRARQRHKSIRRLAADPRRANHRLESPEPHQETRSRAAHRRSRAGRDQLSHQRGGPALRPLLRARPIEPIHLHHRRQHRLQQRRRPLPEIRHDQQSCAGYEGRPGGWRGDAIRWRKHRRRRHRP